MGLGADKAQVVQNKKNKKVRLTDNSKEDLKLIKGAHCIVTNGKFEEYYGIIQALDENSGRAIVKLALKSDLVSLPQLQIEVVSSTEYEKYSKYLSKFS